MKYLARTSLILALCCVPPASGQQLQPRSILDGPVDSSNQLIPLPPVEVIVPADPSPVVLDVDAPRVDGLSVASVEQLVCQALTCNPEIEAARRQAHAMLARVPQVSSLPDPTLMATTFLEEIQTAAGPQQLALSLSQKFPWFGKRRLRGEVAHHDALASFARVATVELKVVESVKRAYAELAFAQQALAETRQLSGLLEDVIDVARTRYEVGAGKVGLESVLQAQVEYAKLNVELVRLQEVERQAQARLAGLLHLPPETVLQADEIGLSGQLQSQVETLVSLADSCHPTFEAFRQELARNQAAVDLARREYLPDVTTTLNWYEMGQNGLSPVANGRDAFSVGVGINLPIYRQRLNASLEEAQHKLCATAQQYEATRDQFQAEIETLVAQFREHDRTAAILEENVLPRADETVKLVLESYRAGRAEFQQLIDAYRTLFKYRIEVLHHRSLCQQVLASLERAVGSEVTTP